MADLPTGSNPPDAPPLAQPVLSPEERARIRLAFKEEFDAALAELRNKTLPIFAAVADPTQVAPDAVSIYRALAAAIDRRENTMLSAETQFRADVSFINAALLKLFKP